MPMVINGREVSDKDIDQRYANTYIRAKSGDSEPFVTYVRGVAGGGQLACDDKTFPLKTFQIVQDFPDMGAVNFKGVVHYLRRRPLRQWSRGLSANVVEDFCRDEKLPWFSSGMNLEQAKSVYDRQWITPEEGIPLLKEEKMQSFAVDARYWYSGNRRNLYLWRGTTPIGQVVGKRIFFMPKSDILKQEIKDELGRLYEVV